MMNPERSAVHVCLGELGVERGEQTFLLSASSPASEPSTALT